LYELDLGASSRSQMPGFDQCRRRKIQPLHAGAQASQRDGVSTDVTLEVYATLASNVT
jgi:hypothetical protein